MVNLDLKDREVSQASLDPEVMLEQVACLDGMERKELRVRMVGQVVLAQLGLLANKASGDWWAYLVREENAVPKGQLVRLVLQDLLVKMENVDREVAREHQGREGLQDPQERWAQRVQVAKMVCLA